MTVLAAIAIFGTISGLALIVWELFIDRRSDRPTQARRHTFWRYE